MGLPAAFFRSDPQSIFLRSNKRRSSAIHSLFHIFTFVPRSKNKRAGKQTPLLLLRTMLACYPLGKSMVGVTGGRNSVFGAFFNEKEKLRRAHYWSAPNQKRLSFPDAAASSASRDPIRAQLIRRESCCVRCLFCETLNCDFECDPETIILLLRNLMKISEVKWRESLENVCERSTELKLIELICAPF